MNNTKCYISGPISHYDLTERKETFRHYENIIRGMGFEPVNPFDNGIPDEAPWQIHLKADVAMLISCEYIFLMRGWHTSKGCKLEFDNATSCGMGVMEQMLDNSIKIICKPIEYRYSLKRA